MRDKTMYLDKFEAFDQPRKPSVTQIAQLQACNRHGGEIWSKGTRGRSCRGAPGWAWDGLQSAPAGRRWNACSPDGAMTIDSGK